jgi:hypothetical protein
LPSGLPAVAIGAAHVAFRDLGQDLRPRFRGGESSDLVAFGGRIAVVEIEHDRVSLATVDAGIIQEVRE